MSGIVGQFHDFSTIYLEQHVRQLTKDHHLIGCETAYEEQAKGLCCCRAPAGKTLAPQMGSVLALDLNCVQLVILK